MVVDGKEKRKRGCLRRRMRVGIENFISFFFEVDDNFVCFCDWVVFEMFMGFF